MSDYHKTLVSTISNSEKWPTFARPDFIQILDVTAHQAFTKQTLEGYLAAFLIYQQISEDMVKNIIKLGRLYNQAAVFPLKVEYESLDNGNMTFGVLLKQLKSVPHADPDLGDLCKELNKLRNQLVHMITLKENLQVIEEKCQEALEIYGKIETYYFDLEESYRISLSDFKNNQVEEWEREYSELLS